MDDLKFRRHAYSDPKSQDEQFIKHIRKNSENQSFVNELIALDSKIEQALNIEVPENLADKILLNQQLQQGQIQHRRKGKLTSVVAIAASVILLTIIGLNVLNIVPINLGQHALAHVLHEPEGFINEHPIPITKVNTQLKSINGLTTQGFTQSPGEILYTAHCDFQGVESLHLVLRTTQGKVTVFILPIDKRMKLEPNFASKGALNKQFTGQGVITDDNYILLVGKHGTDFQQVKQQLVESFI